MDNLPIFNNVKQTESELYWMMEFWNGWFYIIPKNQAWMHKKRKLKIIKNETMDLSRWLSAYPPYRVPDVQAKDIYVMPLRIGQSVANSTEGVYRWDITLYGFMCGKEHCEYVFKLLGGEL